MEVGFEHYFRKPNVNKMTHSECLDLREQMIREILAIEKNFVSSVRLQQLKELDAKRYANRVLRDQLENKIRAVRQDNTSWENGKGILNGMFASKVLTRTAEESIERLQMEIGVYSDMREQDKDELERQLNLINYGKIRRNVLDAVTKRIKNFEFERDQKERKKRQIDELRIRAASNESEIRQIAESLKDKLFITDICPYCGSVMSNGNFHADHIYPVSKGGQSHVSNMVICCSSCNLKKKALTVREYALKYKLDRAEIERRLEMQNKTF